jgi:hypothetical protein
MGLMEATPRYLPTPLVSWERRPQAHHGFRAAIASCLRQVRPKVWTRYEHADTAIVLTFFGSRQQCPSCHRFFDTWCFVPMSACQFVSASSHVTYRRLGDGNCLAQQLLLSKSETKSGLEGADYVNKE